MMKSKNEVIESMSKEIGELRHEKEELYQELWELSSRAIAKDNHIKKITEIVSKQNQEIEDLKEMQKQLTKTSIIHKNKYYDAMEEIGSLRETVRNQNGIISSGKITIANLSWSELFKNLKFKDYEEKISDLLGDLYESKQTEEYLRASLDIEVCIREMNQKIINKLQNKLDK